MKLSPAEQLHIVKRWQEVEGELRVALLRVCLIIAFYAAQLVNYLSVREHSAADILFHRQATYLCATWLFASMAVVILISRQKLPPICKFIVSAIDIVLLTVMICAGSGPASPLVMVYLLIVVMAGLRGSLSLIWVTTLGSLIAFAVLLWLHGQFGTAARVAYFKQVQLKPVEVMLTLLSIGATGVLAGQLVRMTRQIVMEICIRSTTSETADTRGQEVKG